MKKMRLHIYIVLGIFLVGFILGTFLDLNIAQALYQKGNYFGRVIYALGTLPGYLMLAILGGGFFALAMYKNYKTLYKVGLYVLAAAAIGACIFFAGREIFHTGGFGHTDLKWLGFLVVTPFTAAFGYIGFYLTKKSDNEYLWLIYLVMAICMFMALVPGVTLIKVIFHRPRYRVVELYDGIAFHAWYQRCGNYKDLMALYGLESEEFKSFPSGHAGASALLMMITSIIPFIDKKYLKLQLPLFYVGFAWVLFVSFTRMMVGAHFLSDISMGGLLAAIFLLISNEVLIHYNKKYSFYQE